jgi:hypothetical protein
LFGRDRLKSYCEDVIDRGGRVRDRLGFAFLAFRVNHEPVAVA